MSKSCAESVASPWRSHPQLPALALGMAGFALGIAALGAVLPSDAVATSYAWMFGVACAASLGGVTAAFLLLPAQEASLTKS